MPSGFCSGNQYRTPLGWVVNQYLVFCHAPGGENAFLKFIENISDISYFFSFFTTVTDATDVTGEMKSL